MLLKKCVSRAAAFRAECSRSEASFRIGECKELFAPFTWIGPEKAPDAAPKLARDGSNYKHWSEARSLAAPRNHLFLSARPTR